MRKYFLTFILALSFMAAPSPIFAATLYFNAAVDNNWATAGNWWQDSGHTIAGSVPGASDDAVVSAAVSSNSGAAAEVATLTVGGGSYSFSINATTTGGATFNGDTAFGSSKTLEGDVVFNDTSENAGYINDNATFNDTSENAINGGFETAIVYGNATFNDSSKNNGTIRGNATFNDSSWNRARVGGDATFNYASGGAITIITGTSWGLITGIARDASANQITIFSFEGTSINYGTATGTATFAGSSSNGKAGITTGPISRTVTGDATFSSTSNNRGIVQGDATFNDSSYNWLTVQGGGTFNDSSYNAASGTVGGDGTFNDASVNYGAVTGGSCFASTATNSGTVSGSVSVCAGSSGTSQPSVTSYSYPSSGTGGGDSEDSSGSSSSRRTGSSGGGSSSTSTPVSYVATSSYVFMRDLYVGLHGDDVRELQIFLNKNNFPLAIDGYGSPGQETDYFGPLTRASVSLFQITHNISPTFGYFGPITRGVVNEILVGD